MPIDSQLEELLLAEFRRLDIAGRKELLDYASFLLKKSSAAVEEPKQQNQCRLDGQAQDRPETVKEPFFTE